MICALALSGVWAAAAEADSGVAAYVTNGGDGTVTPITITDDTTGVAQAPIDLGLGASSDPAAIALAPDGTIYVADEGADDVSVIDSSTDTVSATINLPTGAKPDAIAVTPDGDTAYVADYGLGQVTAITLTGGLYAQQQIAVGTDPLAIAITPNGELAYVLHSGNKPVTPIEIQQDNTVGPSFGGLPASPQAIAINPDGATGYVASSSGGDLVPFSIPQDASGDAINIDTGEPWAIATLPDSTSSAYVVSTGVGTSTGAFTTVDLSSDQVVGQPVAIDDNPIAAAVSPDGEAAYVVQSGQDSGDGQITPIDLADGTLGTPVTVGVDPTALAVTPFVADTDPAGQDPYNLSDLGKGSSSTSPIHPSTKRIGDKQLTLSATISGSSSSASGSACVSRSADIAVKLASKTLRRGDRFQPGRVIVSLDGKRKASSRRIPLTVVLTAEKAGWQAITAKLTGDERVTSKVRRHGRKVKVTRTVRLTKTFRITFKAC